MKKELSKKSKYYLPSEQSQVARYYAQNYNRWRSEYEGLSYMSGISYENADMPGSPRGSNTADNTADLGLRLAVLGSHLQRIEDAAREAEPEMPGLILAGATGKIPYDVLQYEFEEGSVVPISRATYYRRMRKFWWVLWGKIETAMTEGVKYAG